MTSMLEDVIKRGTGRAANIGRPAAGKTGTTSDYHDAWFVGYTPDLVTGVWVGNDDNTPTDGIMGGGIPASIWSMFMQNALLNTPVHDFDEIVVEQRGTPVESIGGGTQQRDDENYSRQDDDYNYNDNGNNYYEDYNPPSRETYHDGGNPDNPRTEYFPDDTGYNPGFHDPYRDYDGGNYDNGNSEGDVVYDPSRIATDEPIYNEPEPAQNDYPPSPDDGGDKERN